MKFHTYLEGGPFQGAIWSFTDKEPPATVRVALAEYSVDERVVCSEYALMEVSDMAWIRSAKFAAYRFVGEKEVSVYLVDAWYLDGEMESWEAVNQ